MDYQKFKPIGAMNITAITEQSLTGIEALLPDATPDIVAAADWLRPHYVDEQGQMTGVIRMLIVETPDKTIAIDTCIGNDKNLAAFKQWHMQTYDFLDRFHTAGFAPSDIDIVLCTHLHLDHVGWNTYWDGKVWQPTFPNARYLIAEKEYAAFMEKISGPALTGNVDATPAEKSRILHDGIDRSIHAQSIAPIIDAGLVDFVPTNADICAGVKLVPTHGHTQGHVSIMLTSKGEQALITGDCFHHPVQIFAPDIGAIVDDDSALGITTRREILEAASGQDYYLIGSHFSDPAMGKVSLDKADALENISDKDKLCYKFIPLVTTT